MGSPGITDISFYWMPYRDTHRLVMPAPLSPHPPVRSLTPFRAGQIGQMVMYLPCLTGNVGRKRCWEIM